MQLWQKRIIRLWLVIILPVGILSSYQAYTSHKASFEMQELGEQYISGNNYGWGSDKNSVRVDSLNPEYPKEAKEYFRLRDVYENNRNKYAIASIILLSFPMLTWTLAKIYRFVIYGQEEANKSFNKWLKYALCLALIVLAIVVLYQFAYTKKEEAPAPVPVPSNIESEGVKKLLDQFDKEDNARKKRTPPQ
jgi:hypothetical protein